MSKHHDNNTFFSTLSLSCSQNSLEEKIVALLKTEQTHFITVLSFTELLTCLHSKKKRAILQKASLIFTSSILMAKGYSWVYGKKIHPTNPFLFTLSLFRILERQESSVYLLGDTASKMQIADHNLKKAYPKLKFLGKFAGFFPKKQIPALMKSINRRDADFLLLGKSKHFKGNTWIAENIENLSLKLIFYNPIIYKIFSGSNKKPISSAFGKFFIYLLKSIIMPWLMLIYPIILIYFFFSLLRAKMKVVSAAKKNT